MLEYIMKKRKRNQQLIFAGLLLAAVLGFCLSLALGGPTYAAAQSGTVFVEGPVRLHVIANSDSAADQALKLMVRDAVVEYLTPRLADITDHAEAEKIVKASLPALNAIADGITEAAGYGAESMFGIYPFPEKRYGEISMPAGNYRALKIVLGEGAGQNWWCVLFPPLCFVDEAGELQPSPTALAVPDSGTLTAESLDAATKIQVKLKINEIFYIKK